MGSFSWMHATPNPAKSSDLNIMPGDKVRLLIPEALGGGSIVGTYRDYGRIETQSGAVHDVYELKEPRTPPMVGTVGLLGTHGALFQADNMHCEYMR